MLSRLAFAALALIALPAFAAEPIPQSAPSVVREPSGERTERMAQNIFVANKKRYNPSFAVEPTMINAWGLAIRPAKAGGHFWVVAKETSFEYVGDAHKNTEEKFRALATDKLKYVTLPVGSKDNVGTGVVFSDSASAFTITQTVEGAEPITAPAKFLFASDGGIISAWTERKKPDGSFDRPLKALPMIDESKDGAQFFGLTISADYSRLYAANFGAKPGIEVFGGDFKPLTITFDTPFDDNKNGAFDPGEYAPFNIQLLKTPAGENHLFVTYAKTQRCPGEEIKKGTCKKDELFVGEEDTSKPGQGRLAEFTESGKLVHIWNDGGTLSAPWGLAFAPEGFGALSNKLLVANFGDGHIAAFDPSTRSFVDYLNTAKGKPVMIEKIWGLLFGNGDALGDSDALYFTAGPRDEKDGVFGSLRVAATK